MDAFCCILWKNHLSGLKVAFPDEHTPGLMQLMTLGGSHCFLGSPQWQHLWSRALRPSAPSRHLPISLLRLKDSPHFHSVVFVQFKHLLGQLSAMFFPTWEIGAILVTVFVVPWWQVTYVLTHTSIPLCFLLINYIFRAQLGRIQSFFSRMFFKLQQKYL